MEIDHVLIRVENLQDAISDFEGIGFKVYYGNNKKSCHHAMIYFQDGSFLELIDQTKFPKFFKFLARKGMLALFGILFKRFAHYCISKERFLDFAILSENIVQFHQKSKNKSKLLNMTRKNHLGQVVKWKLFSFDKLNLPFVMSEYKPNRFPEEIAFMHQNDILSIKEIEIGVKNSKKYVREFAGYFKINVSSPNTIETGNSKIVIKESELCNIKSLTLLSSKIDSRAKTKLEQYNIKLEKTKTQQYV